MWFVGPAVWITVLIFGVIRFAPRAGFDPGLLNLQSQNAQSVKLVHKLQTWSDAVISKDLQMLRQIRGAVEGLSVVGSTESILDAYDNNRFLHDPANALPALNWAEPAPVGPADLPAISAKANSLATHFGSGEAANALRTFAAALDATSSDESRRQIASRLTRWQQVFVEELKNLLAQFNPPPLNIAALPRQLRSHYVSADGFYALYLNPKEDLWNQESLARFVNQVEARAGRSLARPM